MDDAQLLRLLYFMAVATPVLAVTIYGRVRLGILTRVRPQRIILIAIAGPANLLIWLAADRWFGGFKGSSTPGIILAAIVFALVGYSLGVFGPRRSTAKGEGD